MSQFQTLQPSFNLNNTLLPLQSTGMQLPRASIPPTARGNQSPLLPGNIQPSGADNTLLQRPEPSQDELMKLYQKDQKRKEKQHGYYLKRKEKLSEAEQLSQITTQLNVEILNLRRQLAEKDNIIVQYQRLSLNK